MEEGRQVEEGWRGEGWWGDRIRRAGGGRRVVGGALGLPPLPSLEPLVLALLDDVRLHVVHPRLLAARRPALESRVIDVHRNQPPLVAHLRRERERLAARARAVVDDVLARLCAQQQRNQLGPLVLRVDNLFTARCVKRSTRWDPSS